MPSNASSSRAVPIVSSPAQTPEPEATPAGQSASSSSQPRQQRFLIADDDAADDSDPLPSNRYDSPSLYSGPSRRSAKHRHTHHGHAFPDRADSLRDVATLAKLVDYRSGWYADCHLSSEEIRQRTKSLGWRKAAAVTAFYERQNEILEGWREVDEILDSRFPEEVMRRFAVHEEEAKKRQKSLDRRASRIRNGRLPGDSTDSDTDALRGDGAQRLQRQNGDGQDDEDGRDDDNAVAIEFGSGRGHRKLAGSRPLKRSFSEKAVSAISGFWFAGGGGASDGRHPDLERGQGGHARRQSGKGRRRDRRHRADEYEPEQADEDGYNEDEEEDDDDDEDCNEVQPLVKGRRLGRDSRAKARGADGNGYGTLGPAQRSATELYDRIREEGRYQELRRSESTVTLPGSLQKDAFALPRSGSPTIRGTATPPIVRRIENIPEHAATASSRRALADSKGGSPAPLHGGLDPSSAGDGGDEERGRKRPVSTHSNDHQALLDTVPNRDKEEEASRGVQFAININLLVNILLLGGKGIAVVSSNSVSLIASFVDSALDLLSTVIIFATSKAIAYRSWRTFYKYPVGKKRLEPLGVVIFSVLMVASFCQVFIESVQRLRAVIETGEADPDSAASLPLIGVAFMLATIGIKTVMWLLYRSSKSSGVRAMAQDASNDVTFNIVSLIFPLVGSRLNFPALDPAGGIVLSLYIIYEWLHTLVETIQKLSGATAPSEQVSKCIYLVSRFNSVRNISAFELYHAGDECLAEVDVVLPHSISLKEAHDLGEIITYCTESLEGVERAYVHLDYDARGQAAHIGARG